MSDVKDTWVKRRRVLYITIAFCMAVIVFVLYRGGESRISETALVSAFALLGTCVVTYVFGAVLEDKKT